MKKDHGSLVAADHGLKRSPKWPAVEKAHRAKQPKCLACGTTHPVNVHHKFPFHYVVLLGRPDLELDERNLYTLDTDETEQHHILVGHLDDFESFNPNLEHLLSLCRGLLSSQIRSLPAYLDAVKHRPARINDMTKREKDALRDELDRLFPVLKAA